MYIYTLSQRKSLKQMRKQQSFVCSIIIAALALAAKR